MDDHTLTYSGDHNIFEIFKNLKYKITEIDCSGAVINTADAH
jgi:hypothetical protein